MILPIISIGNSKGIRLPKTILEQCHISDKVEAEISGDAITLKPLKKVRENWDQQLKSMHKHKDDELIISDTLDSDFEDWQW